MATFILFWNPGISSYTKERFLDDFAEEEGVGNWSFYEHEDVEYGDTFYLVKCGEGKTGIVMRGVITSSCYIDKDWSPKNRRPIYYADISTHVCINPWSEEELLTPETLTAELPDFNWYGGHSGRHLDDNQAEKLDDIWFSYLDSHPSMFSSKQAWIDSYYDLLPDRIKERIVEKRGTACEVCGYDYARIFGSDYTREHKLSVDITPLISPFLRRLFYNVCRNCGDVPEVILAEKVKGI